MKQGADDLAIDFYFLSRLPEIELLDMRRVNVSVYNLLQHRCVNSWDILGNHYEHK